ncbi:MAG: NAD(P)-binding domain-containing protein [bacterium]|nr:NAD(P)-binding domain-containing protein [bacterium]
MNRSPSARVCIIGAGPSGIAAAKNCLQVGITPVVYEKGDQVGGNWVYSPRLSHSSVFETTHIISSKRHSQYLDYPMPPDYPDYPSHQQVLRYFQDYAAHFGVTEHVRFNTEVAHIEKVPGEQWRVTLSDGSREVFDYLMVANGHHWNPRMPEYPGTFTGELLHSHSYKTAAPFRDKRVLVVGGGNSACDIAVETSRISAFTAISMRRGYFIVPKFSLNGKPTDVAAEPLYLLRLPLWARNLLMRMIVWLMVGDYKSYGLERPKNKVLGAHLVNNSELLYFLRHGKIHPRRDIARFDGDRVHFVDGRCETYDTVIAATGYRITFPFFDPGLIDFGDGKDVPLYHRVFHPDHPSLFFIGLIQPLGTIWPLADLQSKLAANWIIGNYQLPPDVRARAAADAARIRRQFLHTPRHTIEVEGFTHKQELIDEIPKDAPAWPYLTRDRNGLTA